MDFPSPHSPQTIPVVSTITSPFESSPSPPIDATSSLRKPSSLWPGIYHSPVTNAHWEARSSIFEHLLDPSKDGPPQKELLPKTPSQSRTSIHYNFSGDYILREQYRDPWNEATIGKLLEDLDAVAGTIAVKAGALVRLKFRISRRDHAGSIDINVQILVVDSWEGIETSASVQMQSLI